MSYEETEYLECVCGHSSDLHWRDDGSGKDSCNVPNNDGHLCSCDDFTHRAEPFNYPPFVSVECAVCRRTFDSLDEGEMTSTRCGCDREAEILF